MRAPGSRSLASAVLVTVLAIAGLPAQAQGYPTKPPAHSGWASFPGAAWTSRAASSPAS
jgi:hypothetical protein